MDLNRRIFLLFQTNFCPFTSLATQNIKTKNKMSKKKKKKWRYHHFTLRQHKRQLCDVWLLRYEA